MTSQAHAELPDLAAGPQTLSDRPGWPDGAPDAGLDLDEAFRTHGPALQSRALYLTRSSSDAADLLQETMLHAVRADSRRVPAARARGWLLVIMYNLFLDWRRSSQSQRMVMLTDDLLDRLGVGPAPEAGTAALTSEACEQLLEACLTRLPAAQRAVLDLYRRGLTYEQIAQQLGLAPGTVGTRIHRARKAMHAMLEGVGPDGERDECAVVRARRAPAPEYPRPAAARRARR